MIDRREIIEAASTLGLNPHIVEKDLVLGWVLAGIYQHEALAPHWIFKGGTCLKKCFFETYRFSEDLDFTLTEESHIDEELLSRIFREIAEWIYEETGYELPADQQTFDIYNNPRGFPSCQAKLSYHGPISPSSGGLPRIKLDLTADERIVLPPVKVPIFHPYSVAPEGGIHVMSYAYEEAFAEKVRALAERTRPRDLYDVINLFRNTEARPSPSVLLDILRQKCEFKGINVPCLEELEVHKPDFEGAWDQMLDHQLPALLPVENFWNALPEFFAWMETGIAPEVPAAYRLAAGETVLREHTLRLPVSGIAQSRLEVVRFAASNRLCIDLDYQGSIRRIEPYSLRRTRDGNIILHAFNTDKNAHRSYRVDQISGASTTNQTFTPRYEVELTPQGPITIQPTAGREIGLAPRVRSTRVTRRHSDLQYVYGCSYCGKKFYRKTHTSHLNPHKDKNGYRCSGRHANFIETKY